MISSLCSAAIAISQNDTLLGSWGDILALPLRLHNADKRPIDPSQNAAAVSGPADYALFIATAPLFFIKDSGEITLPGNECLHACGEITWG